MSRQREAPPLGRRAALPIWVGGSWEDRRRPTPTRVVAPPVAVDRLERAEQRLLNGESWESVAWGMGLSVLHLRRRMHEAGCLLPVGGSRMELVHVDEEVP